MPIYEYRCSSCGKAASLFFRSIAIAEDNPVCPHCGATALQRRMSRFWSKRSSDADVGFDEPDYDSAGVPHYGGYPSYPGDDDGVGTPYGSADDEGDVIEFAREAREMARMMGEPLEPDFDDALRYIEQGADPEDVFGEMDAASPEPSDPADDTA